MLREAGGLLKKAGLYKTAPGSILFTRVAGVAGGSRR